MAALSVRMTENNFMIHPLNFITLDKKRKINRVLGTVNSGC